MIGKHPGSSPDSIIEKTALVRLGPILLISLALGFQNRMVLPALLLGTKQQKYSVIFIDITVVNIMVQVYEGVKTDSEIFLTWFELLAVNEDLTTFLVIALIIQNGEP